MKIKFRLYNLYNICCILVTFSLLFSIYFINKNYIEHKILNKVINDNNITISKALNDPILLKRLIVKNYLNFYKSSSQKYIWFKYGRGILKQSAMDSLLGKSILCGETARVMIKIYRHLGLKARRLYMYSKKYNIKGSHVMFEFFDPNLNKWILSNTCCVGIYIDNFLANNHINVKEFIKFVDPKKIHFKFYSNLNYQFSNIFGYKYDIPYFISYFMDEIYLLQAYFWGIISFIFILYCLFKRRSIDTN